MSRETLLPLLAAHVLEHGLAAASLRPLAKAAATSDRMLIYHFGNKEQLLADILAHIADTYSLALDAAVGGERAQSRQEVVSRILAQVREPAMQPFQTLWWEIVAGSARGVPGYHEAAEAVMARLLEWLETQMPENDPDPVGGARYLLTLIEGAQMLSTVGHARTAREGLLASDLAGNLSGD
ncbi:transcriptional regulator, TetR family protein [Erythrobacter sp. NAP1]|uniref:TetR/AcrR family transcriptional regulator n=1 Tax=Erythrobacter sp. NAP1 TaxID=237727 RepID=UPI0000686B5E|nr:TetR/AcrR family transcriptional regulator [Erythrobacter sp. NAP1]EAQ30614.1 transcriptional regulator, TetR family protein [Erythrobacter sp. NAP1]